MLEQFETWLGQTWWLLGIIAALIVSINQIISGTGKVGKWARTKMVGEMERDMQKFMAEHDGCKPATERAIAELTVRVESLEGARERDWESWKLQFIIDDNMLEHEIHDNHFMQLKDCKDKLHRHLLSNR